MFMNCLVLKGGLNGGSVADDCHDRDHRDHCSADETGRSESVAGRLDITRGGQG